MVARIIVFVLLAASTIAYGLGVEWALFVVLGILAICAIVNDLSVDNYNAWSEDRSDKVNKRMNQMENASFDRYADIRRNLKIISSVQAKLVTDVEDLQRTSLERYHHHLDREVRLDKKINDLEDNLMSLAYQDSCVQKDLQLLLDYLKVYILRGEDRPIAQDEIASSTKGKVGE